MGEKKSRKKPRHLRHAALRAARRSLVDITPENSHPQKQSPLFSVLPPELRNKIFEFAVAQCSDHSQPVRKNSWRYRPGHEFETKTDTALLRTCRLIYYETRTIPLRSTTHHVHSRRTPQGQAVGDHWLFHLSSQQGQHLYHLHDYMTVIGLSSLSKFVTVPHLMWKKVTWTIRASLWPQWFAHDVAVKLDPHIDLRTMTFPASCQEVNLELETLASMTEQRELLERYAKACRRVRLTRSDVTKLSLDSSSCLEYTWTGPPNGSCTINTNTFLNHLQNDGSDVTLHVIRLCWRSPGSSREYTHYDHLNCLKTELAKTGVMDSHRSGSHLEVNSHIYQGIPAFFHN
ncbi:hypothetical protein K469DRAFT_6432 [Zopfia rhizophila CBS 207.26]|uniref:F-box domain-containing protein n=1 Tax=Zopfia rhizophila CBS 207.26 TaxID=1314779 RepID=A0A6A6EUK6_9PEZI|nr:hypothetical protein K469DRAFT_6432 [Zopfia rhizophila CBS 207.26]